MKLTLVLVSLLFTSLSFAQIVPEECSLKTFRTRGSKDKFSIENSRAEGKEALVRIAFLRKSSEVSVTKDVLGIPRFETLIKSVVVESEGAIDCQGQDVVLFEDICTSDKSLAVCEQFCRYEWRGIDCR